MDSCQCSIVTFTPRRTLFEIFEFTNAVSDLENRVRGPSEVYSFIDNCLCSIQLDDLEEISSLKTFAERAGDFSVTNIVSEMNAVQAYDEHTSHPSGNPHRRAQ